MYGNAVFPTLISNVTDAVLNDVRAWQSRSLDNCYPVVYLDCLVVKVRADKGIINKAIYLALGVNVEGHKELLGMWISQNSVATCGKNIRYFTGVILPRIDGHLAKRLFVLQKIQGLNIQESSEVVCDGNTPRYIQTHEPLQACVS